MCFFPSAEVGRVSISVLRSDSARSQSSIVSPANWIVRLGRVGRVPVEYVADSKLAVEAARAGEEELQSCPRPEFTLRSGSEVEKERERGEVVWMLVAVERAIERMCECA
jgi:hypothetical protein